MIIKNLKKYFRASAFLSLSCNDNTYLIGLLGGLNELNYKVHRTVHKISILSAYDK